jgi:hypothetical protein
MEAIRYADAEVETEFGDHILYRSQIFFWRWKQGRVSYIPGVSRVHPEMEHDGLVWIGVSGVDGTFRAVLVGPSTRRLQRSVRFVRRSDGGKFLEPHEIPEDQW